MSRLALLLLVLVAVTAAFKKQGACFSKTLGKKFSNGATWTEPSCIRARCLNGRISRLPCGLIANKPGCKIVKGDSNAPFPACCPKVECPKPCFSDVLKRLFKNGDKWTEPGCIQGVCNDGEIGRLPCPLIKPGPGCVLVKGDPNAPYPGCCLSFKCPKPGQCYSKGLDKFFDSGAEWTEPPCQRNRCEDGKVVGVPCGRPAVGPFCRLVKGKPGAPYPKCCPSTVCRCYSKALKKFFNDGDVWTEPPCTRAKCEKGNVVALGCPLQAGDKCVRVEGKPGAKYPKCCPKITCAKEDQCFSKALKKIFDDGAKWTEPKCTEAQCSKGDIIRKACPLIRPAPGCTVVEGRPGASYPGCCPRVVCKLRLRCYSKIRGKYYNDGQTWRETLCERATCVRGKIVRKIQSQCPNICMGNGKNQCFPAKH
ncbi:Extracellular matrix protein FRAS1 [Amphibalanus amphitrite]|uniref:Extracellular matrix protein FRAS1 n=1 Tax=Amphibalanus amphitrite TaxID=1232801 RepID=A0A6A4VK32_AMPAM|nr:extracellular matrix organizing protein FRAS1-like [Amphibalanus amphitrite]KAF0290862.1 Extracellular matrix protein FRAS1 [Amphibalanus amphitrite]